MLAPEKRCVFRLDLKTVLRGGRYEMMREGIPKGRASMSKTTRGKSNVGTRLGEEIEGGRAKLTRLRIMMIRITTMKLLKAVDCCEGT